MEFGRQTQNQGGDSQRFDQSWAISERGGDYNLLLSLKSLPFCHSPQHHHHHLHHDHHHHLDGDPNLGLLGGVALFGIVTAARTAPPGNIIRVSVLQNLDRRGSLPNQRGTMCGASRCQTFPLPPHPNPFS